MDKKSVVPGLVLIIIGVWALLSSLGYEWLSMDRLWPVVVIGLGLLSLSSAFRKERREPGAVWFGSVGMLCGGLFLYITLGRGEWGDLSWLWPAFPAAGGVGWVIVWLVDRRAVVNLVLGLCALAVGIIGLLVTRGFIGAEQGLRLAELWPLTLIVVGLGLIVQFLVRRR